MSLSLVTGPVVIGLESNHSVTIIDNDGPGYPWIEETNDAAWSDRRSFGVTTKDSKMWLLGGYDGSNRFAEVWSSADGVTWALETATPGWEARSAPGVIAWQSRLWLLGGIPAGGGVIGDVPSRRSPL